MYIRGTCKTVLTNSKAEVISGVLKPYINSITCIILQLFFYCALFAVYPHNTSIGTGSLKSLHFNSRFSIV